MRLIKIESKGVGHLAQTIDRISKIPEGWAVVPDNMETPNFPYGEITVEEIDGVKTVTSWTPSEMPVVNVETEPSADEVLDTILGVKI